MKKFLCLLFCLAFLLPSAGFADSLYYLWDIPFPQSARKYAQSVKEQKGLNMDVTFTTRGHEEATLVPGQDATLFGQPFKLEYSNQNKKFESVTVDFNRFHIGAIDPANQTFIDATTLTQSIWQDLITKYGSPDVIMVERKSDRQVWKSGDAPYIDEIKAMPLVDFQTLLDGMPISLLNLYKDFDCPSANKLVKIQVCFHNITVSSSIYYEDCAPDSRFYANNAGLNIDNSLLYRFFIFYPEESSESKPQLEAYSDTGL